MILMNEIQIINLFFFFKFSSFLIGQVFPFKQSLKDKFVHLWFY